MLLVFLTVVDAAIAMTMTLLTVVVPGEVRGLMLSVAIGANTLFGVGTYAPHREPAVGGAWRHSSDR